MFEQRKQGDRRQSAERRVRDEPREAPRRSVDKRISAGVVDRDIPALQRRDYPSRQRPIRRRQRGGLVGVLKGFAQRDRNRQRLLVGVGCLDHRDVGQHSRHRALIEPLAPAIRRGGGAPPPAARPGGGAARRGGGGAA